MYLLACMHHMTSFVAHYRERSQGISYCLKFQPDKSLCYQDYVRYPELHALLLKLVQSNQLNGLCIQILCLQ